MEKQRYLLYKCLHHAANLNNMRLTNKWCDVTIVVNKKVFRAHKVVLAANLKYFENKCSSGYFQDVITMENIEEADLEKFICYAYTGEILLTDSNALGLLEVADYLNEDGIKKACIEFLENHLKVEDALRAYKIGNTIECHTLKNVARQTILLNFRDCSQTTEYLHLDFESLKDVLVGVRFKYEEDITQQMFFDGITSWIMHALKDRRTHTNDLISLIDTTKLKSDHLMKYLAYIAADRNDNYEYIKVKAVTYSESRRTTNKFEYPGEVLMILGDVCSEPNLQFYSFTEKKWSPLQQISNASRMYSNSAILNGKLYYINRTFGRSHLQMFNLTTKQTTKFHSSSSVLSWSSICACSRFLYLCGGREFIVEFDQVLRYDPLKNSYEILVPMSTKRSHAVAIVYQNCLHVLGGRDGSHGLTSVEKCDPDKNNWTTLASMSEGRYGHAAAVLNGKLYVCGGLDNNRVEVYDPVNNSWRNVASMNKKRYQFFVVAHAVKLLAIGGDKEMTVEAYYPRHNEWIIDHELSLGLQIFQPRGGSIQIY